MKRVVVYIGKALLAILLLLMLLIGLIYFSPVQRYIKNRVVEYLAEEHHLTVALDEFRLTFPLNLSLQGLFCGSSPTDTLVSLQSMQVEVGINNLLQQELSLRKALFQGGRLNWTADSSGLLLDVSLGKLNLQADRIDLKNRRVELQKIQFQDGHVGFVSGNSEEKSEDAGAPLNWQLGVQEVDLQRLSCQMTFPGVPEFNAAMQKGRLDGINIDLGEQIIDLDSIDLAGGHALLKLSSSEDSIEVGPEDLDTLPALPWTVRAGSLRLKNSGFSMGYEQEKTMEWVLSGIEVQLDSLYNRGNIVKVRLKDLQAVQQDGLALKTMQAEIGLDSASAWVRGGFLRTQNSKLRMELYAESSVEQLMQQEPLALCLQGELGVADLLPFYADIPAEIQKKHLQVNTVLSITQERLQIGQLILEMPEHFKLTGSGSISDFQSFEKMSGQLVVRCEMPDISFAQTYLDELKMNIPHRMDLLAKVQAEQGHLTGFLRLCQEAGCLTLDANYASKGENYDVELDVNQFDLSPFGPTNSLDKLSAILRIRGSGLEWGKIRSELFVQLKQLGFRGHQYRNMTLEATLAELSLEGKLTSKDGACPLSINFAADTINNSHIVDVWGTIGRLNLQNLQLLEEPWAFKTDFALQGVVGEGQQGELQLKLSDLQMWEEGYHHHLGDLSLEGTTTNDGVDLQISSGDLKLDFRADTSVFALVGHLGNAADSLFSQLEHLDLNMETIQREIPPFALRISGAEDNAVMRFCKTMGVGFDRLRFYAVSRERSGLRMGIVANEPYWGKVSLDSLQLGVWQAGKGVSYSMTTGSSSEEWKGVFNLYLTGRMQGDHFRLELKQQDTQGKVGFDWGINAELGDTATILRFFPENPILGYTRWSLNSDNQVVVWPSGRLWSNLNMEAREKMIRFQSLADQGERKNRLQVKIAGIDLTALSRRVPFMPELSGILGADLQLYSKLKQMGVEGDLGITDLGYEHHRIGTLDLGVNYRTENQFTNHALQAEMAIDSVRRILAEGTFSTGEMAQNVDLDVQIPSFPLTLANAFVPKDLLQMDGEIEGSVKIRGTVEQPRLNGHLRFREGLLDAVMLGTTFHLDTSWMAISDGRIEWNDYELKALNQSRLLLNGSFTMTPFDRMQMDLKLGGRNFELMNVKKNKHSLVYGKAYANIQAQLKGTLDNLSASGNVRLLNRSDITYVMRNSATAVESRNSDFVHFVSFQDTSHFAASGATPKVDVYHFATRMLIEIGEQVKFGVELSDSGNDQIVLQGGGNLIFGIHPETGMTLSGKYLLSSGSVVYNVPVVGKKKFSIRNGSFVEWTNDVMNPILNIAASSQVKADVDEGGETRQATFEAMIRIQNSLSRPDITFDLSAPNDLVIQNQLSTYSAEERTRQALNLLIYNTYTAPGAAKSTGSGQFANHAIYSFVENELNKYTRKAGLTVGFDSHQIENTVRTDVTYQFSRQLFNDRMRVKIGGRVSTDGNDGHGGSSLQDNLVDDISVEYVLTRRRNLYVKVFRQANYESVLDGEVIQTGGGLVWRKNFRSLRDLFKSKKRSGRESEKTIEEREKDKHNKQYEE